MTTLTPAQARRAGMVAHRGSRDLAQVMEDMGRIEGTVWACVSMSKTMVEIWRRKMNR